MSDIPAHCAKIEVGPGAFSWIGDEQLQTPDWQACATAPFGSDWRHHIDRREREIWSSLPVQSRRALAEAALLVAVKHNEHMAALKTIGDVRRQMAVLDI